MHIAVPLAELIAVPICCSTKPPSARCIPITCSTHQSGPITARHHPETVSPHPLHPLRPRHPRARVKHPPRTPGARPQRIRAQLSSVGAKPRSVRSASGWGGWTQGAGEEDEGENMSGRVVLEIEMEGSTGEKGAVGGRDYSVGGA